MPRKSPSFSASASSEFRNEAFDMQQFRNLQDKVFVDGAIWFYLFSLRIYRSTSNLCEHESPYRPRQCKGYHRAGIIFSLHTPHRIHKKHLLFLWQMLFGCVFYSWLHGSVPPRCFIACFIACTLSPVLYRLLFPLHQFPAFCNHLSTTVFSEEADVCL